jgi:hypothetical protein
MSRSAVRVRPSALLFLRVREWWSPTKTSNPFIWLLKAHEVRADVVPLAWVVCPLQYQGTAETSPPSTCKETPVM